MKVLVLTDHHALCWLMKKKNLAGRLARWSLQLQDLDLEIVHRSGHLHLDADALSRNPVAPPEDTPEIPLLSLQTVDKESIKAEQEMSGWWRPIILGLREKDPTNLTRKLIRHYEIREGLLYHRVIKNGRAYYRLCLIPSLVEPVLLACNDDVTAGHLGVTRTLDKIQKRYFWPKMSRKIFHYVQTCTDCQTKKDLSEKRMGCYVRFLPSNHSKE